MSQWAADNDDGLHAYVVTKSSWGRKWDRLEYASSLAAAKAALGWTRERYTSVTVRRATAGDVGETANDE